MSDSIKFLPTELFDFVPGDTVDITVDYDESFNEYLMESASINGGIYIGTRLYDITCATEFNVPDGWFQRLKNRALPGWLKRICPVKTKKRISYNFEVKDE